MVCQLLAVGVPGQGVMVEGEKGGKYAPLLAEIHKNGTRNAQFCALFGLKITQKMFFAQKFLIRYTPKTFLEKYINFKICCYLKVLSHENF